MFVSIFFLPVALLYAFTGIIVLFEYQGNLFVENDNIQASKNLNIEELKRIALQYLEEKNIKLPSMDLSVIHNGGGITIGTIVNKIAFLKGANNTINVYHMQRQGIISYLMALHFGEGKWYFDALAIAFGVCLALFYLSGLLIINFSRHKKALIITFFLGCFISIIIGYLSGH